MLDDIQGVLRSIEDPWVLSHWFIQIPATSQQMMVGVSGGATDALALWLLPKNRLELSDYFF